MHSTTRSTARRCSTCSIDQKLDRYDTDNRPLRDLPISEHAAYQAARLVADTFRNQTTDPAAVTAHIQRHISRIIARTDIDAGQLNHYLLDMLIRHDDLEFELPDLRELESELALHSVEHEDESGNARSRPWDRLTQLHGANRPSALW